MIVTAQKTRTGKLARLYPTIIGIILAAIMVLFPLFEKAIIIKTSQTNSIFLGDFSLLHIIKSLVFGTLRYSPSVLSIAIGGIVFLFVSGAGLFWLIGAVATIIQKGRTGIHRIAVILSLFALGAACALPGLAYTLVSQFKPIYARAAGVLPEDMSGVASPMSYLWAGIIILLVVGARILSNKNNSKEGAVD
jgi:hypothetical protein